MVRTTVLYVNNFQWKINVVNRTTLPCSLPCRDLQFFHGLPSFFCFLLLLIPDVLLPSARRPICPEARLPGPARWGWLPFFKKISIPIPPPKNSRHFSKSFTLPPPHLTPHTLRTANI